ncbi:hypothetical protein PILCRDRAFT_68878 [Piloderma croceum F 1598]|uniref:Glycoside hydrolase family 105 protein n=1 Tax=Piloderma croceum (strain F 1598) TaxID=765440 RepID=A0A0C3FWN5_PILCF|nr:hypothetical protein PILCRDRAFT_68878 [Piloderma croceum F 1598]
MKRRSRRLLSWIVWSFLVVTGSTTSPPGLDDATVSQVRANLLQVASASWELGTAAEALTELSWPALSVFRSTAFPPPTQLNASLNASDVLQIASETVQNKPFDSMALVANDSAVGDPASIGNAVLLANWTRTDLSDTSFSFAAGQQLDYLLNYAPRSAEGAISQRWDQVQLWADFIYMAPPFIAYFAITQGGGGALLLLQAAYDQCRLYRDQLFDSDVSLWRHVALGTWQDNLHWATGNGWAAAGMLRVMETMNNSAYANQLVAQTSNMTSWINEIMTGVWTYQQQESGALLNILDDPTSFVDSSSTALLSSVAYRMATLTNNNTYVTSANKALSFVSQNINANGWLQNTVDPYTFWTPTAANGSSAEGQAFVLLMHAAWRDYTGGSAD